MFRFTIRDVLWLTVVIGLALGWWLWWRSIPLDARVSGHIIVAGQPLASGRILFCSVDGQIRGAQVIKGDFSIDRVSVGEYRAAVEGEGIASRYGGDKSELSVQVRAGKNVFDFALQ